MCGQAIAWININEVIINQLRRALNEAKYLASVFLYNIYKTLHKLQTQSNHNTILQTILLMLWTSTITVCSCFQVKYTSKRTYLIILIY